MTGVTCRCGASLRGDRRLCPACSDLALELLVTLYRREEPPGHRRSLLDELALTATRQSQLSDPLGGRGGAETPLVFHAAAMALYRSLAAFLRRSAHHYRVDAFGDALSARVRKADTPYAYAAWLHSVAWLNIQGSGEAGEFVDELVRITDEVTVMIDRPPDVWFAGPCPTCNEDLYANDGAAVVKCLACKTSLDVAAQRERLLAAVDEVLCTAAEISRAVHLTGTQVTPSKITNLYHRGKLVRHGRNRAGDHLYRMGDVLAVLDAQNHAQSRSVTRNL